jgi:hypothetical protein
VKPVCSCVGPFPHARHPNEKFGLLAEGQPVDEVLYGLCGMIVRTAPLWSVSRSEPTFLAASRRRRPSDCQATCLVGERFRCMSQLTELGV